MKARFLIYGIMGWVIEIFWTGLGSFLRGDLDLGGFTYLWMLPIYGSAVFLEPLHDRIRSMPWLARGVIWSAMILTVEYAAGWTLQSVLGACPWDYRGSTLYTLDGLIRLDYAPAWFVVGLIFERFHDWLDRNLPEYRGL